MGPRPPGRAPLLLPLQHRRLLLGRGRIATPTPPFLARALSSPTTPPPPPAADHNPTAATTTPEAPPPRWLGDLRTRIGKCIMFGCSPAQVDEAGKVLGALAAEWRALVAGSEGFLTGGRRGLEGQQVAWGEMDSFQHVNNVTYLRYAESSRVNWATNFAVHVDPAHRAEWAELMTPRGVGLIMKSLRADYKLPVTYPDRVSVYHKLRYPPSAQQQQQQSMGPTSLVLDAVVLSHRHRRVAARTEEDVVLYDYRAARKAEMPTFMRDVLEDTFRLQEEEKRRARARVWELIGAVERLEKETWDRPDAVEDLGSAGKSA